MAVLGLLGVQALKWKDDPAVYAVAALVTAQIALVLLYLLGRHLRRTAPRESAVAALLGVAAAAVLTIAAPVLARRAADVNVASVVLPPIFDDEPVAASKPPPEPAVAKVVEEPKPQPKPQPAISAEPPAPAPRADEPQDEEAPSRGTEQLEQYRRLLEEPDWLRNPKQEREELTMLRHGLPSLREPHALPSMHASASLFLGHTRGMMGLGRGEVDVEAPLDEMLGEETFETAIELTADFPLAPRHVLRVSFIAMHSSEEGTLEHALPMGDRIVPEGEAYEFTLQWAHLFVGFSQRFVGYTRESGFDFSMHIGVMLDHLSGELTTPHASASVVDDDRGWVAPAIGLTVGLYDWHRSSLSLEILQSVPVNFGGQGLMVTDVRIVVQHDLTETISVMVGYRRVISAYKSFDEALGAEGAETHSRFDIGGPLVGLELRF